MKEITKEKSTSYTVYQAVDGTEFLEKEQCKLYEQSAIGVLLAKLSNISINGGM